MLAELLRLPAFTLPDPKDLSTLPSRDASRPATSTIHPPNKRSMRRIETTSALQLVRALADTEVAPDAASMQQLAELTTVQLPQGPVAERLQLFFGLSRVLGTLGERTAAVAQIVGSMLSHVRALFTAVAPTLRWTTLASLANIIERPCFSRTDRKLASGYLCAFIPQALEDSAPRDKAAVYSILDDLTKRGYVPRKNSNRILASGVQHLCLALRDASLGLRRQILMQHIELLQKRVLTSVYAIVLVQSTVKEFAHSVIATLNDYERDHFERSLRRALI